MGCSDDVYKGDAAVRYGTKFDLETLAVVVGAAGGEDVAGYGVSAGSVGSSCSYVCGR